MKYKTYNKIVSALKRIVFIICLFVPTVSFAVELSEKEVIVFLGNWFEAQNTGEYSKYADMYSMKFVGIRRSGTSVLKMTHDAWLKDRYRMFKKKMSVTSGTPEIYISDKTAVVKFEQMWESQTYRDKGIKQLTLALEKKKIKIVREEMLSSKIISNIDIEDSEISTITSGSTPDGKGKYTSFKHKDCWKPKGYLAGHFDFDDHSRECPGINGWRLFYVTDSEHSWLEIAKGKRLWSTENEVSGSGVYNFGQMQDLGNLARLEWRLKHNATPAALIFQVQATDPNSTLTKLRILYRFYVIGLTKGIPQFCGSFKTKAEARKVADNPASCLDLQERKFNH